MASKTRSHESLVTRHRHSRIVDGKHWRFLFYSPLATRHSPLKDMNPETEMWRELGLSYAERGEHDLAVMAFTAALEASGPDAGLYLCRASSLTILQVWERVYADCTAALHLRPDAVEALSQRAAARLEMNDLDGAYADFTAVIDRAPHLAEAWQGRGVILAPGGVRGGRGPFLRGAGPCRRRSNPF